MGPGTHIEERILAGTKPLNKSDAAAMIHDIEYLRYKDQILPDKTSIDNSQWYYKPLMKMGYFLKDLKGYPTGNEVGKYYKLRHIIETHPNYYWVNRYNLKWSDGSAVRNAVIPEVDVDGIIINDTDSINLA